MSYGLWSKYKVLSGIPGLLIPGNFITHCTLHMIITINYL
jgi:hypothetical protein